MNDIPNYFEDLLKKLTSDYPENMTKSKNKVVDFEVLFEELTSVYPKETHNGRRLHGNLKGCKKTYEKILKSGPPELHNKIIASIKRELSSRITYDSFNYLKMLATYLNQEGWELYPEDTQSPHLPKHGQKFA
ncbi:MAG: hypothetical protein AABY07_00035 [Nanoarchaeota archaeon]